MSKGSELLSLAQKRLYPNYKPAPMILQRGKGSELFDVEGKRWLDMAAGVAVCSVGHAQLRTRERSRRGPRGAPCVPLRPPHLSPAPPSLRPRSGGVAIVWAVA